MGRILQLRNLIKRNLVSSFLGGLKIVWNKGLTKETDERIRKMAEKIRFNAINNPNFGNRGKKLTEEHKRKISVKHFGMKESWETRRKISIINKGRRFSHDINKRKGLKGKLNPFYGKHHTKEENERNSQARKEWWEIPENRAKILNDEMLSRRLREVLCYGKKI